MGMEDELMMTGTGEVSPEMSAMITNLPEVRNGRCREMADVLDIKGLTGISTGIRFVDLKSYGELDLFGGARPRASEGKGGGIVVNLHKTRVTDPDNVYIAISPDAEDSTITHEMAHVLDHLGGAKSMPGILEPLSFEVGVPVEHLEHPEEYGYWQEYLRETFDVQLDADDSIINYLYKKGMLIEGEVIRKENSLLLRSKSDQILRFLSENSREIDALIKSLPGYVGARVSRE